jgi:SAM-dependent methyltransferase
MAELGGFRTSQLTPGCRTGYGFRMAEPTPAAPLRAELTAQAWADVYELLDLQVSPLGMRAIDALSPILGDVVVDVGCGAGQSVLQLAERVGLEGRVIGIDITRRLLDLAKRRADGLPQVDFLEADAQSVNLPDQSADGIFSRFGVMAFADPVAAFRNFQRILKPSGRLAFVCWRSLAENELDLLPLRATGLESMVDPTPFGSADAGFLRATLEAAGFQAVTLQAHDERVSSGSLEAMATVLLRVGPLGRILRENPDLRVSAEPRLRAALADHEEHGSVALRAATWIVTARPGARTSA